MTPRRPKKPAIATAVAPTATLHEWSRDALLAKAQLHADQMQAEDHDSWQFGFWSALTLELIGRAALANVHPALLADLKDWNNLYFAIGGAPKKSRFSPKSASIGSVFEHLEIALKDFDATLQGFCTSHMAKRNAELHSGQRPFENVASSSWLPLYYESCGVLLRSMGSSLELFFGKPTATAATAMIAAAKDQSAKAVAKAIATHLAGWKGKPEAERARAVAQAAVWATRQLGHRVNCPSCSSVALVTGRPIAAPVVTLADDQITETQNYLPSKFECIACGLTISGLPSLHAAGVGDMYKVTRRFDAVDYYAPDDEFDGYEEDNNER